MPLSPAVFVVVMIVKCLPMMFLQVLQKQSELKSSPESSKDQIDSLSGVITDLNNSIKSVEKEIDRKQKDLKAAGKK